MKISLTAQASQFCWRLLLIHRHGPNGMPRFVLLETKNTTNKYHVIFYIDTHTYYDILLLSDATEQRWTDSHRQQSSKEFPHRIFAHILMMLKSRIFFCFHPELKLLTANNEFCVSFFTRGSKKLLFFYLSNSQIIVLHNWCHCVACWIISLISG